MTTLVLKMASLRMVQKVTDERYVEKELCLEIVRMGSRFYGRKGRQIYTSAKFYTPNKEDIYMKMVKGLTAANAAKYGIEVRPDLDFTDDGNRFRGFSYKGLPMTQCRCSSECYLSIRVDYLNGVEFTYNEWRSTEEWELCYEFNGVAEFDIEKLIENLEKVLAKVAELNAMAKAEDLNMTPVAAKLSGQISYAESVVYNFKHNFKWYEVSSAYLAYLIKYMNQIEKQIQRAKEKFSKIHSLDRPTQRAMIESLKTKGYVDANLHHDAYFIKELLEALDKYK